MAPQRGEKPRLFPSLLGSGRVARPRIPAGMAAGLLLALATVALVGYPLLLGRVYDGGDITRLYLPQRVELARALREGRLPWWSARLGLGYPLLAEGEVGALYPPNWIIYTLCSPAVGLTVSILLHYIWAALGMAVFSRFTGRSWAASAIAGLTLALGGFVMAHLTHISMLTVASWIPWLLAGVQRLFEARKGWPWAVALAAGVALQFYGGHPQVSLLGLLMVVAWALWRTLEAPRSGRRPLAACASAILAGALLALPQLLPAAELALASQRAGGVESGFFTSYSFHPLLISTWLLPFVRGAPDPEGSVELMVYAGLLPLMLAVLAVWRGRSRQRWFYVALAAAGLVLAVGRWNPLYAYLQYVPVLNFFRVPARYLFWTSLALAALAGMGVDLVLARDSQQSGPAPRLTLAVAAIALLGVILPLSAADLDGAVAVWRWLPLLWAMASAMVIWMAPRSHRRRWVLLAGLVLLCDLGAYGVVLARSYHTTTPIKAARETPAVAPLLAGEGAQRLYVKEEILPALSVMKGSLYPNVATTHGLASANLYAPLAPQAYLTAFEAITGDELNRLGVSHYLIPQLLAVDEERELYDVYNPLAALPYAQWMPVEPVEIRGVRVESYLSHSADLPRGALAAEIVLRADDGSETGLPIRAGIESAEWAYERQDVAEAIAYRLPPIARSWPARSGYLPWDHVGHSYLAEQRFDMRLAAVLVAPAMPEAFVRIEEITLLTSDGRELSLRAAIGQSQHSIVYRSEDVLVYENEEVWPRAYALPWARIGAEGKPVSPGDAGRDELLPVEIVAYDDLDITLRASLGEEALVVLSDLVYPGWRATVDGQPAEILTVDGLVRGLRVPAGNHEIVYRYHPFHLLAR